MPSDAPQNGVAYKGNDVPIIRAKRAGKQQDLRDVNDRGEYREVRQLYFLICSGRIQDRAW